MASSEGGWGFSACCGAPVGSVRLVDVLAVRDKLLCRAGGLGFGAISGLLPFPFLYSCTSVAITPVPVSGCWLVVPSTPSLPSSACSDRDEDDMRLQAATAAFVLGFTGGFGSFRSGSLASSAAGEGGVMVESSVFAVCLAATGGITADRVAPVAVVTPVSSPSTAACKMAVMEELVFIFLSAGTGTTDEGAEALIASFLGSDG